MSLFKKVVIGVSAALCFAFFVLFEVSKAVSLSQQQPDVVYPPGNLSDNLFVSQNSVYTESEALPVDYSFPDVPYIVDLPDGNTADVGSGHIVQATENVVVYASQMAMSTDFHSVVLSQYPKVVYMNYSQDDSYSMTVKEEYGYFNGLPTTYFVDHLVVSTGMSDTDSRNAYVLGYCFQPENDVDCKMLICVATTECSTEAFENCKAVLDTVSYTVRYDEKLDQQQKAARQDAAREAENQLKRQQQEAERRAKEEQKQASAQSQVMPNGELTPSSYEEPTPTPTVTNSSMSLPMSVTKDFKNMSILLSWTNECENTTIVFNGPNGTVYPDLLTSKQATFSVGACPVGEYTLDISNYSMLGEVSTKLIEDGR